MSTPENFLAPTVNATLDSTADVVARIIRTRRTIEKFQAEVPPQEIIQQAIELACWAPNHKLTEPWRYYVLGRETALQIVELNAKMIEQKDGSVAAQKKREKWSAIPGWLVLTSQQTGDELRNKENYAAVCCAVQNMSLFLWSVGIGMKWTTGAVTRSDEIYEILNVDRYKEEIVGLMWYGYPAEEPYMKRHPAQDYITLLP